MIFVQTQNVCENEKTILMALLFAGLASAPAFAGTYFSCSAGVGLPADWEEVGYIAELKTGLALNAAIGNDFGSTKLEAAIGYQQHDWKNEDEEGSLLTGMVNGYYDFDAGSDIAPYVMAGAGIASLDVSWSTENSTSFVWQVGAGLGLKVNDNVTVDLGYRYLVPEGLECPIDHNDVSWSSHNILAGIRYSF